MLIPHAAFYRNGLHLWGESAPPEGPVAAGAYPYRADGAALREGLARIGLSLLEEAAAGERTIWLPTQGDAPLPSSPLIAEPPHSRKPILLAPWQIPILTLHPADAINLLALVRDRPTLESGMVAGDDLRYWSEALSLAGSLVYRQQVLPSLVERGRLYRACWTPVFLGGDSGRLDRLARVMPPVARAVGSDRRALPDTAPRAVLREFLSWAADHLVRRVAASSTIGRAGPMPASLHGRWLRALCKTDGAMAGDKVELKRLANQIRDWQRPLLRLIHAPYRLCFRLEEPGLDQADAKEGAKTLLFPDAAAEWRVSYLLQARDDPSLLVAADAVWKPERGTGAGLKTLGPNAREGLLAALGQAASLCPAVETSLKAARPAGCTLDTAGAFRFLAEEAPLLEQNGFGVLLPAAWAGKRRVKLTAQAKVKPRFDSKAGMTLDQILDVEWEIVLGDAGLTVQELLALAKLKAPLVRWRGRWVQLSAAEIQAALALQRQDGAALSGRELLRLALGAESGAGLAVSGVQAGGPLGELLAGLAQGDQIAPLPPPPGLDATLRPYQQRGYAWLDFLTRWGLGACLADDMGLGKTVQTLALLQRLREAGEKRPALLVCPTSLIGNWRKEAARFTPQLTVMTHHGAGRDKGETFARQIRNCALALSSYGLLHRDLTLLQEVEWAAVVLDEAQNIKNAETKQAKAARALRAGRRIALTGTPVENHIGDLWSIQEFLNPGFLGHAARFKREFFIPIQVERDESAMERLQRLTGPFILRRLKTDRAVIRDLPEKLEMKVYCTLSKEQATLYAAVVRQAEAALESVEGIDRRALILSTLLRLKQICNHPAHYLADRSLLPGRSGKLARLAEMLEEIQTVGERSLIFTQFAEMGRLLRDHLQERLSREALFLHGSLSKVQRDRMVERFQNDPSGPPVFILSIKAGGVGLNLTRANHVFHFDRWWNPAVENQATDRAFRIGQNRQVEVHKFICLGTVEERIDELIERKQSLAEKIVGSGEAWLTELSTHELKDLFRLRAEAVEA
ncbi:MAG TPA: DEAD/DEAH box helicase [Candidatus Competibacter sp.]|nr:ATP-dependent helicase [Candidatus Competibacteraceae bacterium]HUM95808.1 DEAD/DEAH box helicase [Candidatus Competibacter sp.]